MVKNNIRIRFHTYPIQFQTYTCLACYAYQESGTLQRCDKSASERDGRAMSTPCWVVQSKTFRFPAGRAWRSSFTTVTSVPFSLRLQLAAPTTTGSRQVAGGFVPGSGGNGASKGCSHRGRVRIVSRSAA